MIGLAHQGHGVVPGFDTILFSILGYLKSTYQCFAWLACPDRVGALLVIKLTLLLPKLELLIWSSQEFRYVFVTYH